MRISELSKKCGYEFFGNDCIVRSIRFAQFAEEDSIAIVKDIYEIENTKAKCVLLEPTFVKTNKTVLFISDDLNIAMVRIAKALMENQDICFKQYIKYEKEKDYYIGKNVNIEGNTVISPNVYIDNDVSIGENCYIEPGVHIGNGTIIGNDVYIGNGSSIGAKSFYHYYDKELLEFPGLGKVIIGDNVNIGNNTTIQRGTFSDTIIGQNSKIGNLIDIGHDVNIGINCKIVSQTGIASNVFIGDYVQIFGQVGISNNIRIGNYCQILAKSLVTKNVMDGKKVLGIFAREYSEELRIQAKLHQ